MRILHSISEMRSASRSRFQSTNSPARLGLVPTMGALHEGHLSLIRAARQRCELVAVSIFVNPLQFGPQEDYSRYPRTFANDVSLLEREGVDLLFAPSVEEIYPPGGASVIVEVPEIGARLDGRSRPGHFRGVATIVTKLFHIVAPDEAFFGQKDAAQVAVLRAIVKNLNFDLDLIVCPTVREPDGLAMSSRNLYLNQPEREQAVEIYRSLRSVKDAVAAGETNVLTLQKSLLQRLRAAPGLTVEYARIVDSDSLLPVSDLSNGALVAVAARVGDTRLIDNLRLSPVPSERGEANTAGWAIHVPVSSQK